MGLVMACSAKACSAQASSASLAGDYNSLIFVNVEVTLYMHTHNRSALFRL